MTDPAPVPIDRQIGAVKREIERRHVWLKNNQDNPSMVELLPRVHEGLAEMEAVLATLEIVRDMRLSGPTGRFVAEAIDVVAQIRDGRQNEQPAYQEGPGRAV